MAITAAGAAAAAAHAGSARATDVFRAEVYRAQERPGYACWTVVWRGPGPAVYLAFAEKRRAPNPTWQPIPPAFWESMGLPVHYHTSFCNGARDVLTETVVLRSDDNGTTWHESGRSPTRVINCFSWTCLGDGSLMRVRGDDYVAFDPDTVPRLTAEVSTDGGSHWTTRSVILEGYQTYPYRLKRLRDGQLVLIAPYSAAFGPGRTRPSRHTIRPYIHDSLELTAGVFLSADEGVTWTGPLTALPGIRAWEPDFVELASGDLLFVNSNVQGGQPVRQYFRRTSRGFVPGPLFDVVSGQAPECLLQTRDGLLVGAIRGGSYVCSNDEGANWHPIDGLPRCDYQPYMVELDDGALLCTWHIGGDNFFGELDQWVGSTRFRLKSELPAPTTLTLIRERNREDDGYGNTYLAALRCGDKAVPGQTVQFACHLRYTPDWDRSPDPKVAGTQQSAVTDAEGHARLDLSEFDSKTNIHQAYRVTAWFEPEPDDPSLAPCRSEVYHAYTMTMKDAELGWDERE